MATKNRPMGSSLGMAVDASGGVAYDPSANVIALVEANEKHSEALRVAHETLDRERYEHLREQMAGLRQEFTTLGEKETDRLNSIRQVDVTTSDSKASGVALAVSALSAATNTDKENIRKQLEATVGQINERLLGLERKQSEGAGVSKVSDPIMTELMRDIKDIAKNQSSGAGAKGGMEKMTGWIVSVVMTLVAIGSLVIAFLKQ